jgi:hypothetical protein
VDTAESIGMAQQDAIGGNYDDPPGLELQSTGADYARRVPSAISEISSAEGSLTADTYFKSRPLVFVAASIALAFAIGFVWRDTAPRSTSTQPIQVATKHDAAATKRIATPTAKPAPVSPVEMAALPFSGRIINLANVEWSSGAPHYQAWSRVAIGDELRFDSGVVELMLDNGAQVVLQGPADFRLVSERKAYANRGKLVMRCGPDAIGFEVESPDAKIVDLGTVFGVSIVDGASTNVVVYEGSVDLSVSAEKRGAERRLSAGEALHITRSGKVDRITAVQTPLFLSPPDLLGRGDGSSKLIGSVSDSLRSEETFKYYRVIGFAEDCRAYVDRLHEWNGLDSQGIPRFLQGGDYVMTFNDDKLRQVRIALELLRPAKLYVLMDDRVAPPKWLTSDFVDTGWDVGLDAHIIAYEQSRFTPSQLGAEIGPGRSVDRVFSIWLQELPEPTVVELGSLRGNDLGDVDPYSIKQSMYGVVVQPLHSRRNGR